MNKNYLLLLIITVVQIYSCKKSGMDNSVMHVSTGPDVYVAGYANGCVYWKNDSAVSLPWCGETVGINVSGNDVYVGGTAAKVGAAYLLAAYWKNGSLVYLTDGSNVALANSIYVSGNDVYVSGYESNGTHNVA